MIKGTWTALAMIFIFYLVALTLIGTGSDAAVPVSAILGLIMTALGIANVRGLIKMIEGEEDE